jgi:P4 family phage/plasmid primase-like protien
MIKQFCEHLGLKFLRQEGSELIHKCPLCKGDKLYINSQSGAWQCFHGCGEGYPYQLVRKLTSKLPGEIFDILDQFGLNSDRPKSTESAPKKLYLKPEDVRPLRLLDQLVFSHAKNIDFEALLKIRPYRHRKEPWVLLPAFDPTDLEKACGWIRAGIDGQPVVRKYREDGVVKTKGEKYPLVKGSAPGLVGLHALPPAYDTVVYCEGWKDCVAALSLGLPAIANSNGAGKWRESWSKVFQGKTVYIIGDCDPAGVKGAEKIAEKLWQVAKEVKIVTLPYEVTPKDGKDLHDYITETEIVDEKPVLVHTADDLSLLFTQAPLYEPQEEPLPKGVVVLPDDHPDTIAEAFERYSSTEKDVRHKYNRFDGWSIFHNGKYQAVEDTKEIRLHIRKFLSKCYVQKTKSKDRVKQSSGFVSDILEALAALPEVHLLPNKQAPCSLDGSLDVKYIIAAANLLIDISERPHRTHPITDQFYTRNYLKYDYVKDAFPDKWAKFLVDITCGDIDLMLLLQQWCGYLLLPTLEYQKFMLCVGDGANGKGVFFDTITAALGQSNVSNVPLARLENPYALFGTYGKLVNMSNENARNIESNAESIIKEYVAGDKIAWEQKYKDAFFAYPTAKLMFATNELPKIKDVSDGIWRRMILVPFNAKFSGADQNINLAKELQQPDELAGILNWMIEGAEVLEKHGRFVNPAVCRHALETYRNESDSVRLFLIENTEEDTENIVQIPCTWLHQQYQKWCEANGFKPKNNVHFGQGIFGLYPIQKSRPWFGNRRVNVYTGLKLQDGSEVSEEFGKWTE